MIVNEIIVRYHILNTRDILALEAIYKLNGC